MPGHGGPGGGGPGPGGFGGPGFGGPGFGGPGFWGPGFGGPWWGWGPRPWGPGWYPYDYDPYYAYPNTHPYYRYRHGAYSAYDRSNQPRNSNAFTVTTNTRLTSEKQDQIRLQRSGIKDKTIEVSIHSAVDLKEMNWFTEMTPYAVVTLAAVANANVVNANQRTSECLRVIATGSIPPAHGKNPLWDLKLTFDVEQLDFPVAKMTLLVTIYSGAGNSDGNDRIVGRVNPIQIEDIIPRNGERSIYRIDSGGTISLTIKYTDKSLLSSTISSTRYTDQHNSTSSNSEGEPSTLSSSFISSSSTSMKDASSSKGQMDQSNTTTTYNKKENNIDANEEDLPVATVVDITKTNI